MMIELLTLTWEHKDKVYCTADVDDNHYLMIRYFDDSHLGRGYAIYVYKYDEWSEGEKNWARDTDWIDFPPHQTFGEAQAYAETIAAKIRNGERYVD